MTVHRDENVSVNGCVASSKLTKVEVCHVEFLKIKVLSKQYTTITEKSVL